MGGLVYFSSLSGNTARFVEKLEIGGMRIPVSPRDPAPTPQTPFVLFTPTYADGQGRGAVPKQVIRFLNDPDKRRYLRGVIAGGNRNFGALFAVAGDVVARKCDIPMLYRFELAGNEMDVTRVRKGLDRFWKTQFSTAS